jgi:hypothetical protein
MPQYALPTTTPSLASTSRLSGLERMRTSAIENKDDRWGGLTLTAQRIRGLERELRRKDAALAEAAALLVLRKKLAAMWGESEDA